MAEMGAREGRVCGGRTRGREGGLALTWCPVRGRELPGLPPMKNSDEYTSTLADRPEAGLPGGGPNDILFVRRG